MTNTSHAAFVLSDIRSNTSSHHQCPHRVIERTTFPDFDVFVFFFGHVRVFFSARLSRPRGSSVFSHVWFCSKGSGEEPGEDLEKRLAVPIRSLRNLELMLAGTIECVPVGSSGTSQSSSSIPISLAVHAIGLRASRNLMWQSFRSSSSCGTRCNLQCCSGYSHLAVGPSCGQGAGQPPYSGC